MGLSSEVDFFIKLTEMEEDYTDNRTHCCICSERCGKPDITCPSCNSVFHKECWNEAKVNCICPYCRGVLFDSQSLRAYSKGLLNKHNEYFTQTLKLTWIIQDLTVLSHITPKHPYVIQILRGENIFIVKPWSEMDRYERYMCEMYRQDAVLHDTIIPLTFPITERAAKEITDRIKAKLLKRGNSAENIIDLMTDELGNVIDFDSIWKNPEKFRQLLEFCKNGLHVYTVRDYFEELECELDEEIKFKCRDCGKIIFKNNKCVNCGREYDNPCCALCKQQSELIIAPFDYKLQKHRIEKDENFDEIIYCKECKRAYVMYSRNGETKRYKYVKEVDPPYELIKDDWNPTQIFNYSNSLKSQLITNEKLSKLLQLADADEYKANKAILKELLKIPKSLFDADRWEQEHSIIVRKLFIPHLIVRDNKALILRVLQGDDPAILDRTYKILEAYGYKV